ncbi:MAG: hypothetical protein K9L62_06335 [Vallitaleaceae bacterium]|nr:hypothetical protein [Vallitaleaceae bacterium]
MKKYRQLKLLGARALSKGCRALHLTPPAIAQYQIDIDGIPQFSSKSESWNRNFLNMMTCANFLFLPLLNGGTVTFGDGVLNTKKVDGSISSNNYGFSPIGATDLSTTSSTKGIVLGSSDVAETFDDHALTQISYTDISYQAGIKSAPSWDAVNRKWSMTLTRSFVHDKIGTPIVVKEIGHISGEQIGINDAGGEVDLTNSFLIIRDLLPTPITINPGQVLTVSYTIEYAY